MTDSLGQRGETYARVFFEKMGFSCVAQNWHCRYGELDLIMKHEQTIHFIEVKTRRSHRFGAIEESITKQKRERLVRAVSCWIEKYQQQKSAYQLDALLLEVTPTGFHPSWIQGI